VRGYDDDATMVEGEVVACHRNRVVALLLAELGARVVVNDPGVDPTGTGHDNGPAAQVVEEIRRKGGEALTNFDSVASME